MQEATLVVSEEGGRGEAEEREEREGREGRGRGEKDEGGRELHLMYLYPQKAMMSSHLSCETTASR